MAIRCLNEYSAHDISVITIIDIEASGLHADSYPIEVGVALASGERHSMLICPEESWTHWDSSAESLHGIARDTLLEYGKPAAEIAERLNTLLEAQQTYSDAWVVDKPWMVKLFEAAQLPMSFQLSTIEQVLREAQILQWDAMKKQVTDDLGVRRHRASHDAWIIQQTYVRLS